MGYMDRKRCEALLGAERIDALVIVQPENFRYATGAHPGFLSSWRRAGTQAALVPGPADRPLAVVVADALGGAFRHLGDGNVRTHPAWIDFHQFGQAPEDAPVVERIRDARGPGPARPATYDLDQALEALRELLAERGLDKARIGIELDFIPVNDLVAFKNALPAVEFVDSSLILKQLQLIKSEEEISLLKRAAEITETGLTNTAKAARPGLCARDLSLIFQTAILAEVERRGVNDFESSWAAFCCGPNVRGTGNSSDPLQAGHAIKLDCGCSIAGYISDVARTYFLGRASRAQKELYKIVLDAWMAGFEQFVPGNPVSRIYSSVEAAIHGTGFTGFRRGHYGHSIGASVWNEEWPYISENEHTRLEKGMVFAFEVPFYLDGLGSFTIEDHVVVTANGAYSMNALGKELREL